MAQETFGQRLQRLRIAAGFTQARLAKAAGLSFGTLRNWEYDKREPLLSAAVKLAAALSVSVDELAGVGAEDKPERKRGKK
jgi:transcriptional regulator with XRE-family HTH domain